MTDKYKDSCRYKTRKLIKKGKLKKGVCDVCGTVKVECHHNDYNDPENIRWLCKTHHSEVHRKIPKNHTEQILVKCTIDYKEGVRSMAKSRGMSISEFVRFLIEKQKEADRK